MRRLLNKKVNKDQSGFTLIELLVAIAIIGLIASIVMTSLSTARKRGRDAKRVGDLRQINTAIQLYIGDIGHAPYVGAMNCSATNPSPVGECGAITETDPAEWTLLQTDLSPYIQRLPKDPCGAACYIANPQKFYSYSYHPPSTIKSLCGSCGLSNSQLNNFYNIFAESMELSSPNYVKVNDGFPTYGIMSHTISSTSF